jgi:16S rRNA (uracil1498-N3)-methyltransferase
MPDPRLHIDGEIASGGALDLDEAHASKLTRVLRLGPGAGVRVFNGAGEWAATIVAADKKRVRVAVGALLSPPRQSRDVTLLFAPLKRDATDLVVEKATELGVRAIAPVYTARTIVEAVRIERWALVAKAAAEQSERFDLPEIAPAIPLARALDGWDTARPLAWCDESGDDPSLPWGGQSAASPPMLEALAARPAPRKAALLIGPEGGFTSEEQAMLRALPFVIGVSLGPRILRAETAAIAGLTLLQAAWGDLAGDAGA